MVKIIISQENSPIISFPENKEQVQDIITSQIDKIIILYENIINSDELTNLTHHLRNYVCSICSKITNILLSEELKVPVKYSNMKSDFEQIMSKLIQIELYGNKQQLAKVLMEKNTISNSSTIFNNI